MKAKETQLDNISYTAVAFYLSRRRSFLQNKVEHKNKGSEQTSGNDTFSRLERRYG